MAIYLDLVVILNFLVDFFLFLGTNRLCGFPSQAGRCALGAALGGIYSGACLLPGFSFLGNMLWRTVSLMLMCSIVFGWNLGAVRRTGIFLILTMALGGISLSMGQGNFIGIVLCAGLLWLLCRFCLGSAVNGQEYVSMTLRYQGQTRSFTALRDTGNTLRDPITGEQVLIVSPEIAEGLTGLSRQQLSHPLETMTQRPLPGLRLIPYRAVGQAGGMLLGLRFDQVMIGSRTTSAIVAFAPEGLGQGGMVQALTGGMV